MEIRIRSSFSEPAEGHYNVGFTAEFVPANPHEHFIIADALRNNMLVLASKSTEFGPLLANFLLAALPDPVTMVADETVDPPTETVAPSADETVDPGSGADDAPAAA